MTSALAARAYYELGKPRMVYANVLVAAAAFIYGSGGVIDWGLAAVALVGLGCVIASGCALNNICDREMDAKMERTRHRGDYLKIVGARNTFIYGSVLAVIGFTCLWFVNIYALFAAAIGWVAYVLLYTPLKPRSPHALFVGAVAGAMPPVVGYAAAAGTLDAAALALFAFLFVWQLPHFVAISIYRGEEYAAAGVPMFFKGPHTAQQKKLARGVFFGSLVVLLAWCALLVVFA